MKRSTYRAFRVTNQAEMQAASIHRHRETVDSCFYARLEIDTFQSLIAKGQCRNQGLSSSSTLNASRVSVFPDFEGERRKIEC